MKYKILSLLEKEPITENGTLIRDEKYLSSSQRTAFTAVIARLGSITKTIPSSHKLIIKVSDINLDSHTIVVTDHEESNDTNLFRYLLESSRKKNSPDLNTLSEAILTIVSDPEIFSALDIESQVAILEIGNSIAIASEKSTECNQILKILLPESEANSNLYMDIIKANLDILSYSTTKTQLTIRLAIATVSHDALFKFFTAKSNLVIKPDQDITDLNPLGICVGFVIQKLLHYFHCDETTSSDRAQAGFYQNLSQFEYSSSETYIHPDILTTHSIKADKKPIVTLPISRGILAAEALKTQLETEKKPQGFLSIILSTVTDEKKHAFAVKYKFGDRFSSLHIIDDQNLETSLNTRDEETFFLYFALFYEVLQKELNAIYSNIEFEFYSRRE
jgi:hypothetical protein